MQLGMIGLGRMGHGMTERLREGGHDVQTYDPQVEERTADSLEELKSQLDPPRAFWMMVPSGKITEDVFQQLLALADEGDTIVDGGNSNFRDSKRRYVEATQRSIHFVDAGVSGGIWGLEVGFCLMVGGDDEPVGRLEPILEINPFDQPDVQAAKDKTKEVLSSGDDPQLAAEGSMDDLLAGAEPPNYVAIQAFVDPVRERELQPLIDRARETGCAVTHGLGPRYLHSTGQLHKGGPPTGLFVQVVDDTGDEIPIPGRDFGFGRLIRAQAEGDFRSLRERGRQIVRVRLEAV